MLDNKEQTGIIDVSITGNKKIYGIDKEGNLYLAKNTYDVYENKNMFLDSLDSVVEATKKFNNKFIKQNIQFKAIEFLENTPYVKDESGRLHSLLFNNFPLVPNDAEKLIEYEICMDENGELYNYYNEKIFDGIEVKKVNGEYCIVKESYNIYYAIDENGDIYDKDGIKTSDENVKFLDFYTLKGVAVLAISTDGEVCDASGESKLFGGIKVKKINEEYCISRDFNYAIDENGDVYDEYGIKISDGNVKFFGFYDKFPYYFISTEGVFYNYEKNEGISEEFAGIKIKNVNGKYCISGVGYCIDENGDIYRWDGTKTSDGIVKFLEYYFPSSGGRSMCNFIRRCRL